MTKQKTVLTNTSNINTWINASSSELKQIPNDKSHSVDSIVLSLGQYDVKTFITNQLRLRIYPEYDDAYLENLMEMMNSVDKSLSKDLWWALSTCKLNDNILNTYFDKICNSLSTWSAPNDCYSRDTLYNLVGNIESNVDMELIDTIFTHQKHLPMIFFEIFIDNTDAISKARNLQKNFYFAHYDKFNHELIRIHHPEFYK